jgi:cellulose synthase/poly-beta-1,6-N-acetylglucosamine synthase-like glycosyltransferase
MKARLLVFFIIFIVLTILIGKMWVGALHDFAPLYFYGISVTLVLLITYTVVIFKYRDPCLEAQKKAKTNEGKSFVSCMVAVKNEEKIIELCIKSFLNQTYTNKEIVFVNDASTDGTRSILDDYANKGLISVIHLEKNVGKKKALATAILRAKGDIFAFSDSDSVLAPDAIARIVDIFDAEPLVGAVSGHCRALNADDNFITKVQDSWYETQYSVRKAFESVFGVVSCVSGPLAVFRREAVYNLIPAWENDTFLGQEFRFATDRTLTALVLGSTAVGGKLKKKYADSPFVSTIDYPLRNWKTLYCKSARAWTVVPPTFGKLIKQQIRWKKSFIRNIFFNVPFYWRKPFLPALFFYLHIIFVLAGPFVAFRHLIYLPMNGNFLSPFLYIGGICLVGFTFGLAFKKEDETSHRWIYRPVMSLLSTLVLSWLVYYATVTIKKMTWYRG